MNLGPNQQEIIHIHLHELKHIYFIYKKLEVTLVK